ncbi:MAG: FlgD immunoglobulin-like domain containing protein, partial [candidate division Zixibacteria bacterium]|nr:FlgD immunoglobulin-like domain containing protein [candidate division Zixibacteria bacterium]
AIYNILGQQVAVIADGVMTAGTHDVTWQGTDNEGNAVTSGVYFYRLKTSDMSKTRKMILMK